MVLTVDVEQELEQALAELRDRQDRIAGIQDELGGMELTGYADRGAVTVTMSGAGRFTDVQVDPAALRGYDAHELGRAVLAAIHDVVGNLAEETRKRFAEVAPDDLDALDAATSAWRPPAS
jgi:hypothetical protein